MHKIILIITLLLLSLFAKSQTNCISYNNYLKKGNELLNKDLDGALYAFQNAQIEAGKCKISSELADDGIKKVFTAIKNQKIKAENSTKEAERNLREMSELIIDLSDLIQSEKSTGIIGFKPLKAEMLEKLITKQEFISKNSKSLTNPIQGLKAYLQLGLTSDDLGNTDIAAKYYKLVYEECLKILSALSKTDKLKNEETINLFLKSTVYYSWYLMNINDLLKAKNVIDKGKLVLLDIFITTDKYYSALSSLENTVSRYYSEIGNSEEDYNSNIKAIEYARNAVLLNPSNILHKAVLAVYLNNLTLKSKVSNNKYQVSKYKKEGCSIANALDEIDGNGNIAVKLLVDCGLADADSLIERRKYQEAKNIYQAQFNRVNNAYHLDPSNKEYLLIRSNLFTKYSAFCKNKLKDTTAQIEYTAKAINNMILYMKNRAVLPIDKLWLLKNTFDDIIENTLEYPMPEREKIYKDFIDAFENTASVYGKVNKIAVINSNTYFNYADILTKRKTKADSVLALSYLNKTIVAAEKANLLDTSRDFTQDLVNIGRAYSLRIRFAIANNLADSITYLYEDLLKIFMPSEVKFPFDFYLNQAILGSSMNYGEFMFTKGRYKEAIPALKIASKNGVKRSTEMLISIYKTKEFFDTTTSNELKERLSFQDYNLKKFNVPLFGNTDTAIAHVYIVNRSRDYMYKGIDDQAEWFSQAKGFQVPQDVKNEFIKLQEQSFQDKIPFTKKVMDILPFLYSRLTPVYERLYAKGEKSLSQTIDFYSEVGDYYFDKLKQNDSAKLYYKKIVILNPDNYKANKALLKIRYLENTDLKKLVNSLTVDQLHLVLGFCLENKQEENAKFIVDKILELKDNVHVRDQISQVYLDKTSDHNFKSLFLQNKDSIEVYRNYFINKYDRSLSNELTRIYYYNLTKLDDAYLKIDSGQSVKKSSSQHNNSMAYFCLLTKNSSDALFYLQKSIKLDSLNIYAYSNFPHYFLFNNQFEKARKLYLQLKNEPFDMSAGYPTFKEAFLSDFKEFEKAGLMNDNIKEIIRLLNEK